MSELAPKAPPLLGANNLHLQLGGKDILRGVSLDLHRGEVQCIMGASGCGKSSMLRCLNFLEIPSAGSIAFDGKRVGYRRNLLGRKVWDADVSLNRYRTEVGMVFQGFNVWPHMTALENLSMPLRRVRHMAAPAADDRARSNLDRVGLLDKAKVFPTQLSGGQLQRLAIARALATEPAVLLLDEPTSSLDPELVQEVVSVIGKLAESGMTMLIVTHEIHLATNIAERLFFMDRGLILESGRPADLVSNPGTERLRSFLNAYLH